MNDLLNRRTRLYFYDQYVLNEQAAAFSKYDPDRIVNDLCATGADVVTVYATNQFGIAYYPSHVFPQHPNLNGRDYFGEITERLRARGKKIMAYTNWLDSKHPEWNLISPGQRPVDATQAKPLASWANPDSPTGRVQNLAGHKWNTPCYNSPHRDEILAVAREICERYKPDMFHLDMFLFGICVCHFCRPELERICGTSEITREILQQHWVEYVNWRMEKSGSFIRQLSELVHGYGVLAAHNAFAPLFMPGYYGISEQWLPHLDVHISECFDQFQYPGTDLNSTSLNVRWQRATGKPSWTLVTSHPIHYTHHPLGKVPWELYAAACKANGCKSIGPCGVGAKPDTTSDPRMWTNVKYGFDYFMADADLDEQAESVAKIALVFSWASRNYDTLDCQWLPEFVGWSRLLIEEHLPFEIVIAENVKTADVLKPYELVIIPESLYLAETFCAGVRFYVQAGGRLLVTGETGRYNERGALRDPTGLADVLGIEAVEGVLTGHFAVERPIGPEPVSGRFRKIQTTGEVLARYVRVDPAGSVSKGKDPLPVAVSDLPAVIGHNFGQGHTRYVPFNLGKYFEDHGDQHIGIWMAELIDSFFPERQVRVKAPRTVEITVWRQPQRQRTIIHLANRSVAWTLPTDQREITEILPVCDVEIELAYTLTKPKVTARHAEVKCQTRNGRLFLTIQKLSGAYAAIIIESENAG